MKSFSKIFGLAALTLTAALTSCEGEKDLIIIEEDLPIKTSTLYMVGDATPNGWSIDAPTALTPSEEDPLIFTYEGVLNPGEMKLCLTPGSWDAPFIRPAEAGLEVTKAGRPAETFVMHAGDPDLKWRIADKGIYKLIFNLRNWTAEFQYVGEVPKEPKTPIETEVLYMVGDATPNGWNIDAPTQFNKESQYIFTFEGDLKKGDMKCCMATGSWDAEFIRPTVDGVEINRDGVADSEFTKSTGPDNKWKVTVAGKYKLTFDLQNWTIAAQLLEEAPEDPQPGEGDAIEAEMVFAIGDALESGWSLDAAPLLTVSADNKYIYSGELKLGFGDLKFGTVKDFGAAFIHPVNAGCLISKDGVADNAIDFYAGDPDAKWRVNDEGTYKVTLDLQNRTIAVEYVGEGGGEVADDAINTDVLYIVGDASPKGWSLDEAIGLTKSADDAYIFTYEGELNVGEFKFCIDRDWGAKFIRPEVNGTEIDHNGMVAQKFLYYAGDPDNKWKIVEAGKYRLTLDLKNRTFAASFVE